MYRLMSRIGLGRSPIARAVVLSVITWLPLAILSALHGVAVGDRVRLPFLLDISAYARFLIAVPLLVLSERTVDRMLRPTIVQFTESGVVKEAQRQEFESAVGRMVQCRDAVLPEVLLLLLAFAGSLSFGRITPAGLSTWHDRVWWYSLFSIPIFQFLLYRWFWRFGIWSTFLWRMSKLDLQIIATHPDLRGGLAFLSLSQAAFSPVIFSMFIVLAATVYKAVAYANASLPRYLVPTAILVVLSVLLFLIPLLFFTPKLTRLKIASIFEYGVLASKYTTAFDRKWVRGKTSEEDKLLGTPDIQSLADLINSYKVVREIRIVPFGLPLVVTYLLSAIVPLLPLIFLAVPAVDVGEAVLKAIRAILG